MSEQLAQTRRDHEGLQSRRDAPIGGQAVLEGVMMRGVSTWAVAVRKPQRVGFGHYSLLSRFAARRWNRSTRPPVSTSFWRPV